MEQRAFLIEIKKLIASITSKNMTVKGVLQRIYCIWKKTMENYQSLINYFYLFWVSNLVTLRKGLIFFLKI